MRIFIAGVLLLMVFLSVVGYASGRQEGINSLTYLLGVMLSLAGLAFLFL